MRATSTRQSSEVKKHKKRKKNWKKGGKKRLVTSTRQSSEVTKHNLKKNRQKLEKNRQQLEKKGVKKKFTQPLRGRPLRWRGWPRGPPSPLGPGRAGPPGKKPSIFYFFNNKKLFACIFLPSWQPISAPALFWKAHSQSN